MSEIETRKSNQPFLIGIFVFISVGLGIGAIFWLGANKFLAERNYYVTYFDGSVEGLEQGSSVKYQGVPVGSISKIKVAPDGYLIEIIMQIDTEVSIDDSLRVKTVLAGLAGSKFLQLHYTDNPFMLRSHPEIDFDLPENSKALIKSTPSDIEEITIATQKVINNLKQLEVAKISEGSLDFLKSSTEFLDTATRFLSQGEIRGIIQNLQSSSENLNLLIERTNNSSVIEDISLTSQNLLETSVKLEMFVDRFNTQLDSLRMPYYLNQTYAKYDTLISEIRRSIALITYRTDDFIQKSSGALEEFKKTSRSIRKTSDILRNEPNKILAEPIKKER